MSASREILDGGSYSELLQRLQYHNSNTPLGVIEFDADLRIVGWNEGAQRIFGWESREVLGKIMWDIPWIHPEDRHRIAQVSDSMVMGGASKTVSPNRNLRKDGSVVWCEWYNSSLTGPDGKTRSIQSLVLDVTQRQEAEAQLRRAKELSEAVNRVSQVLHSTLDPAEVVRRIMVEGVAALGCDSAAVSERKDGGWVFRYVHGMPEELVGQYFQDDQKRHAVLASEIRDIVSVADAFNDPRFNREHFRRHNVRSVLVAPLIIRGVAQGVVFFYYRRQRHDFTETEESFTRQIGSSAATALEHAHLFEEQKRVERELRNSEVKLRAVLEASTESIWLISREGELLLGNATAFRRVKRTADEVIGKKGWDLLVPELAQRRREMLTKVAQSGEPAEFEDERDGISFHHSLYPVTDEHGDVISVAWFARDITRRKRVTEQMRQRTEELEKLFDALPAAIWISTDPDCRVIRGNQYASAVFCVPRGSNVSASAANAVPVTYMRDGRPLPTEDLPLQLAAKTGQPQKDDALEIRFADGRSLFLAGSAVPLLDEQGRVRGVLGAFVDITERKRAEEALKENEQRFRALADSIPNLAWWADAEGNRLWFNRRWYDYTGTTAEQMMGAGWQSVHDPKLLPLVLERLRHSLAKGVPFEMEFPLRGADGQYRWFLTRMTPLRDAAGHVVRWFGTNTDVTENREARQVLAKHKEELEALVAERTAKLQEMVDELEHFSYSITHDMRAPLRAMRGFAELLARDAGCVCTPEEEKMLLERIITAAERMDGLITDSLNYSRAVRQELPLSPVDVGKLLRGMLDSYPEFQIAVADIVLEYPLPQVLGNEAGLTQCFSNLLGNAVKFVKPGEKPRIRVRSEQRADGWVRLWVEDNGIGISSDLLPRVFEMFSRGASPQTGTGIGLALVRKVVHRMSGRVGVESQPGQGSRFWIELKAYPPRGHGGPG